MDGWMDGGDGGGVNYLPIHKCSTSLSFSLCVQNLIERERILLLLIGIWVKWKKVPSIFLSDGF